MALEWIAARLVRIGRPLGAPTVTARTSMPAPDFWTGAPRADALSRRALSVHCEMWIGFQKRRAAGAQSSCVFARQFSSRGLAASAPFSALSTGAPAPPRPPPLHRRCGLPQDRRARRRQRPAPPLPGLVPQRSPTQPRPRQRAMCAPPTTAASTGGPPCLCPPVHSRSLAPVHSRGGARRPRRRQRRLRLRRRCRLVFPHLPTVCCCHFPCGGPVRRPSTRRQQPAMRRRLQRPLAQLLSPRLAPPRSTATNSAEFQPALGRSTKAVSLLRA